MEIETVAPGSLQTDPKTEMTSQRIVLTTYPNQPTVNPVPLQWAARTAEERGPVVVTRDAKTLPRRNAIGAYGGSYSIYRAIALTVNTLDAKHRPDYTNTEPPFEVPYNEAWSDTSKITSLDPWGHVSPLAFKSFLDQGLDLRPTISCTKAHIKMPEVDRAVHEGRLVVDGKVLTRANHLPGALPSSDPGVEVSVAKAAVDPVWYLPGVAARFGVEEDRLRRSLFEHSGGMYAELLTRPDIKTFLPPIGGSTVYAFGDISLLRENSTEVTVRVHDECNGSDVFGSDICTCRPYLLYGIEECIKTAQRGGVGIVVYFRKEGRALGEVVKYLVYNARKRGEDTAATYFKRTEDIAGVKDMRFQALMPDVLHWLGIKHITNLISMSDMKYDAIVNSGITVKNRYEIPDSMMPADSKVEIDAKIHAGYFSASRKLTDKELQLTLGRKWEEEDH